MGKQAQPHLVPVFCQLASDGHGGYDLKSTSRRGIAGLHTNAPTQDTAESTVRAAIAHQYNIDPAAIIFVRPSRPRRRGPQETPAPRG